MDFDFTRCSSVHFSGLKTNSEGIPVIRGFKEKGLFPYPVTVSQYGIYQLQLYQKTDNESYLNSSVRCSEWLYNNAEITDESAIWRYNFKNSFLGIEPPWICGLAQVFSSWLLYSHKNVNEEWEAVAYKALSPFFREVKNNGLSNHIDNYYFLEEYPSNPPSATLNGSMYIMIVLNSFLNEGYSDVEDLFSKYVENLAENLYRYDTGFWSLYDLWRIKRLSSIEYHWLHTYQLSLLYQITGINEFYTYYKRWMSYWNSSNSRFYLSINKIKEKLCFLFFKPST